MTRSYRQKRWAILLLVIAQFLLVTHIHSFEDDHAEHCKYCLLLDHALPDNSEPATFFVPFGVELVINLLSRDLAKSWVIRIHPRGPPA